MGERRGIVDVDPICIECGGLGVLTPGSTVHPHREDLWGKNFYVCACGARVGCHPGTTKALGRPAGPRTALARDRAHRVFDPIWQRKVEKGQKKGEARQAGYTWLAGELGIAPDACHISWFDEPTCRRVIEICRAIAKRIETNKRLEANRAYAERER